MSVMCCLSCVQVSLERNKCIIVSRAYAMQVSYYYFAVLCVMRTPRVQAFLMNGFFNAFVGSMAG